MYVFRAITKEEEMIVSRGLVGHVGHDHITFKSVEMTFIF